MNQSADKRAHERFSYEERATLESNTLGTIDALLLNISRAGVGLSMSGEHAGALQSGQQVVLTLTLPPALPDFALQIACEVRYVREASENAVIVGVAFIDKEHPQVQEIGHFIDEFMPFVSGL